MRRMLIAQGVFWLASALFWSVTGIGWWAAGVDSTGDARMFAIGLFHAFGMLAGVFALIHPKG